MPTPDEVLLQIRTILDASGLEQYGRQLDKAHGQTAAATSRMSAYFKDFGKGILTVASGLGAYQLGTELAAKATAALQAVTTGAVEEFNNDARVLRLLETALTNMGRAADTGRLADFAGGMQDLSGKTDDSIMSMETYFATLGHTADETERLTKLALNMAPVFGSVEGAMRAVERATNGEVGGLSRLGIEFTEAQKKGEDVEGVIRKLEAATQGQAAAFKTSGDAIARSFENLQGAMGKHMAPMVSATKSGITEIVDEITRWINRNSDLVKSIEGVSSAQIAAQKEGIERRLAELQRLKQFNDPLSSNAPTPKTAEERGHNLATSLDATMIFLGGWSYGDKALAQLQKRNDAIIAEETELRVRLAEIRKHDRALAVNPAWEGVVQGTEQFGPPAAFKNAPKGDAGVGLGLSEVASSIAAAEKMWNDSLSGDLIPVAQDAFELLNTKDFTLAQKTEQQKLKARLETLREYEKSHREFMDRIAARDLDQTVKADAAAKAFAIPGEYTSLAELRKLQFWNIAAMTQPTGGEQFGPPTLEQWKAGFTDIEEIRKRAKEEWVKENQAQFDLATFLTFSADEQYERAKVLRARKQEQLNYEVASVQEIASVARSVIAIASAIQSGNAAGVASGAGGLLTTLGGFSLAGGGAAAPWLIGAGVGLELLSPLLATGPRTEGGKARERLYDALGDSGLWGRGSTMATRSELEGSGKADLYQQWAELVSGSEKIGKGGEIMYGAFKDLPLTLGESADAVGHLIAQSQGLSEAAGDQLAAQEALLSNSALTGQELSDLAKLYADSTSYLETEQQLRKEILDDAKAYGAYLKKGGKEQSGKEWEELKKDRDDYINLMQMNAEQQKKSDEDLKKALIEKGMGEEDAQHLIDAQKSVHDVAVEQLGVLRSIAEAVGAHHQGYYGTPGQAGQHLALIRNDEDVIPPERRREYVQQHTAMVAPAGPTFVFQGPVLVDERSAGAWMARVMRIHGARREG